MMSRLSVQSKKFRVALGLFCVALAAIPPVLLACDEYHQGPGNTCTDRFASECGTQCYGLEDCDIGLWHSPLNPYECFYGCRAPGAGDPDGQSYNCPLDESGGCIMNLFMSYDCTMWVGYAVPYCLCECNRAY